MEVEKLVRQKWRLLKATLAERARRFWAGAEADAIGYWGRGNGARATKLAISTVRKGRDEARADAKREDVVNVRRSAGKRPFEEAHPEVLAALEKLVDPITRGDPGSLLRWTCKSTHALFAELCSIHSIRISDKIPYGIYDLAFNDGFVSVCVDPAFLRDREQPDQQRHQPRWSRRPS